MVNFLGGLRRDGISSNAVQLSLRPEEEKQT